MEENSVIPASYIIIVIADYYKNAEKNKLPYVPYKLKEWMSRFNNKGEYTFVNKNRETTPQVQINTGRGENLISLNLAQKLLANIEYSDNLFIESYLPEKRIQAVGKCTLTVLLRRREFREVEFYVVRDNSIAVVLGSSFYCQFKNVCLLTDGLLPPLQAKGYGGITCISYVVAASAINPKVGCQFRNVRLDTGSGVNLIKKSFAKTLGVEVYKSEDKSFSFQSFLTKLLNIIDPWRLIHRPFASIEDTLRDYCFCDIVHECNNDERKYRAVKFHVVDEVSEDMVLGMEFILNHEKVDIKNCTSAGSEDNLFIKINHPVYGKKVRFQGAIIETENH